MKKDDALPRKIAVLMGGPGSERDVSLATGHGVSKALRSLGVEVVDVDVRDEHFELPQDVDLAFLTIHGTFGEDGQLQKILEDNVTTPHWQVVKSGQNPTIPLPIVVKPPRQGSTVGVVIVKDERELDSALMEAAKYDGELLIEKFVPGREFTIGILS